MERLEERLDRLKELLKDRDFLEGRGLSNEVNIRIFSYDPKEEMAIRYFIDNLSENSQYKNDIEIINLFEMAFEIMDDYGIVEDILEQERKNGSQRALSDLIEVANIDEYIEKIEERELSDDDIIIITGIGEAYPFIRLHDLLNVLPIHFPNNPIIAFYPGDFKKHQLVLFGKFKPSDYYRAFNII